MGFLARIFGAVPSDEQGGIRLEEAEPWEVSPTRDVERFLRALSPLVPDGSILYLEDTAETHVAEYLQGVSGPGQARVAVGTIWPRPDCYHVPLTSATAEAFARFLEQHPAGFVCAHCHVYHDGLVVLEWHDAFMSDPMYVSRTIGRGKVAEFAARLGSSFGTRAGGAG
jgi:hypothetical protein